jgi:hypothetical protein
MTPESIKAANQTYQTHLGWTLAELFPEAPPTNGTADVDLESVRELQQQLGVKDDAVVGPGTYTAVLARNQAAYLASMDAPGATPDHIMIAAGLVALTEAKLCWLKNIIDLPPKNSLEHERCRKFIDSLIRTDVGIGWHWEDEYEYNGQYEWCGTLAAKGWGRAGVKFAIRQLFFSSNYRLDRYARYKAVDKEPVVPKPNTPGPHRMIIELDRDSTPDKIRFTDGSVPREGDIMLIGGERTGYGKHITMIDDFDPTSPWVKTVEGNGTGYGPNGNTQHGVVRAQRRIGRGPGMTDVTYIARRIIRVGFDDLVLG